MSKGFLYLNPNLRQLQIYLWSLSLIAISCRTQDTNEGAEANRESKLKYARGFEIRQVGECKVVEVLNPYQGSSSGYKYLLVPHGIPVPAHDARTRVIRIPVQSIVCTSTTHLPLLEYLGHSDKLVGFPSTNYISSKSIRELVDQGKVIDLGHEQNMDMEKLTVLEPDMVMGYTISGDYGQFKKIEDLGIPVVINAEYLERHPLGRAEWIKFMALFVDEEDKADSVFAEIEKEYVRVKNLTVDVAYRPTVVSGIVYGDTWFLPGGKNYGSQLLKDAGCKYLWEDDDSFGFLELSFENVYGKAYQADLWIGAGNFLTLQELNAADHRYSLFKAFKQGNVYTYSGRTGQTGGSEFLELGYLRPDIILKDLVRIAHPDRLPGHKLYFHQKLK